MSLCMLFSVTLCFGDDTKKPVIKFVNKVHKFDSITASKGSVSHEFIFKNVGTIPLVILKSSITCKCTKVKYSKKPILPGEKGVIKVTFNPRGVIHGVFTKNIQIYSNAKNRREILTIMGVLK